MPGEFWRHFKWVRLPLALIPAATVYVVVCFCCCLQRALAGVAVSASPGLIVGCCCLGTAVLLAGSPSFPVRALTLAASVQAPKDGATAAAWRSARGVPQAGFASGSLPYPHHPHNEHPASGLSDSRAVR